MSTPYEDEFHQLPTNIQTGLQAIFKRSNDKRRYYAAAIIRLLAEKDELTTTQLRAKLDEIPRVSFFRTIKKLLELDWVEKTLPKQGKVFYKISWEKEDQKLTPVWLGDLRSQIAAYKIVGLLKREGENTIEQIAEKLQMPKDYARLLADDLVSFGWLELSEDNATLSVLPKRPMSALFG